MTEIFINEKKIAFTIEQEKTVGEILGSIESACEKSGMTITSIKVDGSTIPASGLDKLFKSAPNALRTIELETISGPDVLQMMRDLGPRFASSVPHLKDIPILLQTGKDISVMETINGFSMNLQDLYRILPLLHLTGLPTGTPTVGGSPLTELPGILAPLLEELLGAMKNRDTVLVGDLSEYELAPRIEQLSTALSGV